MKYGTAKENEREAELQAQLQAQLNDLKAKINFYIDDENIMKDLSPVQKKQLETYYAYIGLKGTRITQNEITSINNHIRSAISTEKNQILQRIDKMIKVYTNQKEINMFYQPAPKSLKLQVLEQLQRELTLLPDKYLYLSEVDSKYFTDQLDLLESNKFILREELLKKIDSKFLEREIDKYPHSYIDEVNKLRLKVRRKPVIMPTKTAEKIMNKLKRVTHDYIIPYLF